MTRTAVVALVATLLAVQSAGQMVKEVEVINLPLVQDVNVLGHAKASHTLDIYADAIPSRVDEAMERLGVLVSEGA